MSGTHAIHEDTKPWYRQFWPWFLIALPTTAVVAAFISLGIAIRQADDIVDDDYYKDGLAINQKIERDDVARKLGLSAHMRLQSGNGTLFVELPGSVIDNTLTLQWMHPLRRQFDKTITLTRDSGSGLYIGRIEHADAGRYYLELDNTETDAKKAWRLRGEIRIDDTASQAAITLAP